MARVSDEAELESVNSQLELLSRTDGLTGVANRRFFDEAMSAELNRAIRSRTVLTLFLCDIDYFKNYNDSYGHQAGDECLKKITDVISSHFSRSGEVVARYGGEEFAVILPGIELGTAKRLAESMRSEIEELGIPHASSGVSSSVTVSVGVATVFPDMNTTISMIIERADKALYEAKKAGRNNVR